MLSSVIAPSLLSQLFFELLWHCANSFHSDKFEWCWCEEKLQLLLVFPIFGTTCACCTDAYRVLHDIFHVQRKTFFTHCVVQVSLTCVSENSCIVLCMQNALDERYWHRFLEISVDFQSLDYPFSVPKVQYWSSHFKLIRSFATVPIFCLLDSERFCYNVFPFHHLASRRLYRSTSRLIIFDGSSWGHVFFVFLELRLEQICTCALFSFDIYVFSTLHTVRSFSRSVVLSRQCSILTIPRPLVAFKRFFLGHQR